jgi:hypothetical protein
MPGRPAPPLRVDYRLLATTVAAFFDLMFRLSSYTVVLPDTLIASGEFLPDQSRGGKPR